MSRDVALTSFQELEAFLKTGDSENTGFAKSDGSGESIGHESGRKIVDILKRNPDKVGTHPISFAFRGMVMS